MSPGRESPEPELSVVIVAGNWRVRARRALESALSQEIHGSLEVLVIDLGQDPNAPLLEAPDHRVRVIPMPPSAHFGEARAHAVRLARAPVIAFLEEHCRARPGWASGLLAAHREAWACVGSTVYSMNPGVGWSDAVYLLGYAQWIPPAVAGEAAAAAAHNSSYKRASLEPLMDRLPLLLLLEPLLQQALVQRGERIFFQPSSGFEHQNETNLRSLRVYYWWNRCLGRERWAAQPALFVRKLIYTLLSPLAPWVRSLRDLTRLWRRRRELAQRYLYHLPRILVLHYVATLGLVVGSWTGAPSDDLHFTNLELRGETDR
ncbi:MAG TPA: glycosyltransferase family A protein [Anaerolineales bacterium]|nr:glycosyltransferase family A protein [Anaerolineales bacterium]